MTTSKSAFHCFFVVTLLFFCLAPSLLWAALPVEDLETIRKQHFSDISGSFVKRVSVANQDYYFISASTYSYFKSSDRNVTKKLVLRAKSALYKYIKEKDDNLSELKLQHFYIGLKWKENNKTYLLCYVACKNVSRVSLNSKSPKQAGPSILKKDSEISHLDDEKDEGNPSESSVDQYIDNEIAYFSSIIKNHPDSIPAHEELCELYKLKGNIDKVDELLDTIIELKFKQ